MRMLVCSLLWAFLFNSCSTIKYLEERSYSYKSKNRKLEVIFRKDSVCEIKNIFYCEDIDPAIKNISFLCKYKRKGNSIYLHNLNPDIENKDMIFYLPPQNSIPCYFLNKEHRKNKENKYIGPDYMTPYEKYGVIPNITNDTLYIIKNKIVYYKSDGRRSIGFVFQ